VFISLFYMLRSSLRIDICPQLQPGARLVNGHWVGISHAHTLACGPHGGASFLFVNDLTNKATGAVLIVLIVLYVGTQLFSSLLMSSPTMDQTQRRIMLFMPLFFVVFIISFPAGVIVYWITTNSWTILQQYIVRKRLGPMGPLPAVDAAAAGSRGGGGGSGEATAKPAANGAGGGLAGLLRSRMKPSGDEPLVGAGSRGAGGGAPPPPPPRKKKKRSGRRR
jgi:YidC/Oxa1 family membrane protein insertase